jgi:cell division protein FtsW
MNLAVLLPDMPRRRGNYLPPLDFTLIVAVAALLSIGLVMVASASMPVAERLGVGTFYFAIRQAIYLALGLALALLVLRVRMAVWERGSLACILFAILLLLAVLVPGVGIEVNGSTRWINLAVFRLQVSEPSKLLALVYLAGYLVRRSDEVLYTRAGFLKPLSLLMVVALLLLLEPDFGATVVLITTALAMLFMAGVSLWKFAGLIGASIPGTIRSIPISS